MSVLATRRNMRKYYLRASLDSSPYPFSYSPVTGERYSATPGDYFLLQLDEPVTDSEGEPMLLVFEHVQIVDADAA